MLRLETINTGYDKKQVLFDISFEVIQGDIALLIGSNGSGKSTLLKTIFGLNKIWSGSVFFENEKINNIPSNSLLQRKLMYIPQKNNVFEQLTVKENFEISGLMLKNKKIFSERFTEILEIFPTLQNNLNQTPMKMSGGERQQLVIAMALIHKPKMLLIDEPFNGLSPNSINHIANNLVSINKSNNVTILLIEHRIKESMPLTNQLIGLKLGKILLNTKDLVNFDDKLIQQILI